MTNLGGDFDRTLDGAVGVYHDLTFLSQLGHRVTLVHVRDLRLHHLNTVRHAYNEHSYKELPIIRN